jgi:hypothetical protein
VKRFATLSLAATVGMIGYLFVTSHGTVDSFGRPLGTDFSNVWTAGRMALDGRAALAWDWPSHFAVQQATHHKSDIPFYCWHYPPPFLLIATLLALMPYVVALIVWQASTLGLALVTVRKILRGQGTTLAAIGAAGRASSWRALACDRWRARVGRAALRADAGVVGPAGLGRIHPFAATHPGGGH